MIRRNRSNDEFMIKNDSSLFSSNDSSIKSTIPKNEFALWISQIILIFQVGLLNFEYDLVGFCSIIFVLQFLNQFQMRVQPLMQFIMTFPLHCAALDQLIILFRQLLCQFVVITSALRNKSVHEFMSPSHKWFHLFIYHPLFSIIELQRSIFMGVIIMIFYFFSRRFCCGIR